MSFLPISNSFSAHFPEKDESSTMYNSEKSEGLFLSHISITSSKENKSPSGFSAVYMAKSPFVCALPE